MRKILYVLLASLAVVTCSDRDPTGVNPAITIDVSLDVDYMRLGDTDPRTPDRAHVTVYLNGATTPHRRIDVELDSTEAAIEFSVEHVHPGSDAAFDVTLFSGRTALWYGRVEATLTERHESIGGAFARGRQIDQALTSLAIKGDTVEAFQGVQREIPVEIKNAEGAPATPFWGVYPAELGYFTDNLFHPGQEGEGRLIAVLGTLADTAMLIVRPSISSFIVSPATIAFTYLGEEADISVRAPLSNGDTLEISDFALTSRDTGVAQTVGRTIRALAVGETDVNLATGDTTLTVPVTVTQLPASIELLASATELPTIGSVSALSASVLDAGGSPIPGVGAAFALADTQSLSLSGDTVTAIEPPGTWVFASCCDNTISDSLYISVAAEYTAILPTPTALALDALGAKEAVRINALNVAGDTVTLPTYDLVIADSSVVSFEADTVTALSVGDTELRIAAYGLEAPVPVSVTQEPFGLTLSVTEDTLRATGARSLLNASVFDRLGSVISGVVPTYTVRTPASVTLSGDTAVAVAEPGSWIVASSGPLSDSAYVAVQFPTATIDQILVEPATMALESLGEESSFDVWAVLSDGDTIAGNPYTVAIDDSSIVSVAGNIVRALSTGSTQLTISIDSLTVDLPVTVSQVPAALTLEVQADTLHGVGATTIAEATARDVEGNAIPDTPATFTSRDPSSIEVRMDTLVAVTAPGAWIVAECCGLSDSTFVAVTVPAVASQIVVDVAPDTVSTPYDELQATATVMSAEGDTLSEPVTWSVTDSSLLSVTADGLVTPVGVNGDAWVIATSGALRDSAQITVDVVWPPASLVVTAERDTMHAEGETQTLTAVYLDAAGNPTTGDLFAWSSSNTSVATVDPTGLVTAGNTNGSAWVRASGSTLSDSVEITVYDPDLEPQLIFYTSRTSATPLSFRLTGDSSWTSVYDSVSGQLLASQSRASGESYALALPPAYDGQTKRVEVIADTAAITQINLQSQEITGGFPIGATNFRRVSRLEMMHNPSMRGAVPESIARMEALQRLYIRATALGGEMPDAFATHPALAQYFMEGTNFTGELKIGPAAVEVDVSNAALSGALPEFSTSPDLHLLRLENNDITTYSGGFDALSGIGTTMNGQGPWEIRLDGNALDQSSIDGILQDLHTSARAYPRPGAVALNGGSNAAPTPGGEEFADSLRANDWSVVTNGRTVVSFVAPDTLEIIVGDSAELSLGLEMSDGDTVAIRRFRYANPTTSTISVAGTTVYGLSEGLGMLDIRTAGQRDTVYVSVVSAPASPDEVILSVPTDTLWFAGDEIEASAVVLSEYGDTLAHPISFALTDSTVATVDAAGVVRSLRGGETTLIASSEGLVDSVALASYDRVRFRTTHSSGDGAITINSYSWQNWSAHNHIVIVRAADGAEIRRDNSESLSYVLPAEFDGEPKYIDIHDRSLSTLYSIDLGFLRLEEWPSELSLATDLTNVSSHRFLVDDLSFLDAHSLRSFHIEQSTLTSLPPPPSRQRRL